MSTITNHHSRCIDEKKRDLSCTKDLLIKSFKSTEIRFVETADVKSLLYCRFMMLKIHGYNNSTLNLVGLDVIDHYFHK